MAATITRLTLGSGVFGVNAYLIETELGFVLVDTGMRTHRRTLEARLAEAGCTADSLRLIVITHGDADHIGNAAHLRRTLGTPIAMHQGDVPMARDGDMFAGRRRPGRMMRVVLSRIGRVRDEDRFEPDVLLDATTSLSAYGLQGASVLLLGGHSSGSIALLLADGSLLCGDVLENRSAPRLGSIMDNVATAQASLERLRTMRVATVYPGHGAPFEFTALQEAR